ncbi:uncharacterized protein BX664DRAFT_339216 [Halteromyces radiatus]|uniref:uncharacterized protein n=1 Tax=Halteromyces radiatus TaxID=101107 RepID=UPI00221FE24D|nr:uncharacterized protein BX664DRAFT_339216 [Halteromyces radiatus]KAI8082851.1 hypothetical protein BX664DRAFT_339216 [Halteromyces radiatus]
MSPHHLHYPQSVIVNVLRAIVSRSISTHPSTSTTTTHWTRLHQHSSWSTSSRISGYWFFTSGISRHQLMAYRLYSSSSPAICNGSTTNFASSLSSSATLDYDHYLPSKDILLEDIQHDNQFPKSTTKNSINNSNINNNNNKKKKRINGFVYRPFLDKWVLGKHFKLPKKLPETVEDYNKYILFAVLNDQQNKAIKWLRTMEKQQLKPDIRSYTMIIHGYSKQSDMVRAMKWLKRMRRNNISPDVYIYTTLIDGYMRHCNVDKAEQLFKKMMQYSVQPNLVTYNVLMHHSVLKLDMETAVKFWGKLAEAGLQPDVYTYAIFIHGLGDDGLVDEAWRIFDRMKQQGVDINNVVATTLMGIHVKHKDNAYAVQLFREFFQRHEEKHHHSLIPTQHTRNTLLNAMMGNTDLEKINSYYQQFQSMVNSNTTTTTTNTNSPLWGDHIQPCNNVYTYTTFMRAYLRRDDIGMVSQVYQDMIRQKIRPTLVTFSTLMLAHAFVPDPHACENMLKELQTHGIKINVTLYTIVMRAWAKAKQWDQVKRVYEEMKTENIQPNKVTMEVLRWAKQRHYGLLD